MVEREYFSVHISPSPPKKSHKERVTKPCPNIQLRKHPILGEVSGFKSFFISFERECVVMDSRLRKLPRDSTQRLEGSAVANDKWPSISLNPVHDKNLIENCLPSKISRSTCGHTSAKLLVSTGQEMNGTRVLHQANSQGDKQASAIARIMDKRRVTGVMTAKLRNRAPRNSEFNELLK